MQGKSVLAIGSVLLILMAWRKQINNINPCPVFIYAVKYRIIFILWGRAVNLTTKMKGIAL